MSPIYSSLDMVGCWAADDIASMTGRRSAALGGARRQEKNKQFKTIPPA